MNDEVLKEINSQLEQINKKTPGNAQSIVRGILTGFGYVVGVFLAVLLIGWVLTAMGIIPAFTKQADEWKTIIQNMQRQSFVPVENSEVNIEK